MTPNTGTARWMAPELFKSRNTDDIHDLEETEVEELVENDAFKGDVYSFGMVCLEILTGDFPFPNLSSDEVKRAVCAGERPQIPERCHGKLKELIEKCWSPKASSRPSFGDIRTELRYLKSLHMRQKSHGSGVRFSNIMTPGSLESCQEFSRRCLEEVRKMTSPLTRRPSKDIEYNQCKYLADSLDKAVQKASLFLEHNHLQGGNSVSTEDVKESTFKHFKILCMLTKKVKYFIHGFYKGHSLQTSVITPYLSDCTASLGFDLKLFTILLPPYSESRRHSRHSITIDEVSALRHVEGELVRELAFCDLCKLLDRLCALKRFGHASNDDLELATSLLERLDVFDRKFPSISLFFRASDLAELKDMVQIGIGGCCTVHKASWLGIDVAVKTFYGTDNPEFKKEVPILATLFHPNILSFLCHGKDLGESCIAMELMDGDLSSPMKERLQSSRTGRSPFSVFEEFDIMLQIAEAMYYLRKKKVLHRGLKSHNILVRHTKLPNAEGYEYVQVKVSDFGLSRTKEFIMTQSQMTPNTGTARWMAPELFKSRNTDDIHDLEETEVKELMENDYPFKGDVYSSGMVCMEILTGDVPFPNKEPHEVKRAVCAGERPQIPERCHGNLKELIEKCWSPAASSRPYFDDICTELRYLKSLHMTQMSQGTCFWTFTIADLQSVTGNFAESNFLSRDECSVVHKGILADGRKVAVKRVTAAMTGLGFKYIELELRGWVRARCPHLVETLGYCIDGNDFLLVTEYMSKGTLAQRLAEYQESNPDEALLGKQKLMIAMDVARALVYLHKLKSIFLHFNLKSSNVLLDR